MKIEIGNIEITYNGKYNISGERLDEYNIVVNYDGGYLARTVYCNNLDRVVLAALSLKHAGVNGQFETYAARMLQIDENRLWWSS